jgi:hypothetical protein
MKPNLSGFVCYSFLLPNGADLNGGAKTLADKVRVAPFDGKRVKSLFKVRTHLRFIPHINQGHEDTI